MLKNRNIVCIANPLYEGDYAKTIVELMNVFALQNKVLFVENPFSFSTIVKGLLGFYHEKTPTWRVLGLEPRLRKLKVSDHENIFVLTPPPILPINKIKIQGLHTFLHRINTRILLKSIQRTVRKLDMAEELIEINAFQPGFGVAMFGKLNAKTTIYHCYDEINASTWLNVHGGRHEEKYLPMVDAVITTSQGLFDKKKKNTKNIFLVPNAVNFQLFNQGFTEKVPTQKTIGYVGNLDSRIAIEALEKAIQTLSNCQFEFAGVVSEKTYKERLEKYSNVTFLGTFHPSQLPGILSKWAVGIIPFVKNDFTRGVYPLKINEYLAVGLPVVSTRFSVIEGFNHIVNFVEEESQLTSAIKESIGQDNEQKRIERNAFAALQTWENRVDLFSKYIEKVEEN